MRNLTKSICFTFLCLFLFSTAKLQAVSATDDQGATITLQKPAKRIISLAPHTTELLFAAGAGDKIVGAVRYSYYPEVAKTIPTVGDTNKLDLERIIALAPDLIVAWQSNAAADTEVLRNLNIPIYVSEPASLEAIARSIEALGILSGSTITANRASAAFLARLKRLREEYSGKPVVTAFYQFWHDPIFTINGDHIISAVMQLCGGRNIFSDMAVLSGQINAEAVISANPQVILASAIDENRPPWLAYWQQWPELAAVRNGQIYYIPPDLIQRHTPRVLDGAAMMCEFIDKY
ncbi:MAG: Cobalamin-binding protein [Gammaproteobacteria bacterium]|nr:Cobalamin-binding protein [Gammaproteobacteria bacterium]